MPDSLHEALQGLETFILGAELRLTAHLLRTAPGRPGGSSEELTRLLQQNLVIYWQRRQQLLRAQESLEACSGVLARMARGREQGAGPVVEARSSLHPSFRSVPARATGRSVLSADRGAHH